MPKKKPRDILKHLVIYPDGDPDKDWIVADARKPSEPLFKRKSRALAVTDAWKLAAKQPCCVRIDLKW